MTEANVKSDLAFLEGQLMKSFTKWRRNFNRYANNGRRIEDLRNQYGQALAYYNLDEGEDTGTTPNLNVARMVVDTHVSKVSEIKVRPFFNPVNGTFKTLKTCRNAQVFFDQLYEEQDVYRKGVECARFADIFERGVLWLDDEDLCFKRLAPWEYLFDGAEWNFGKLSRCAVKRQMFPLIWLKDRLKESKEKGLDDLVARLEENPFLKGEYILYYDLVGKKRYSMVNTRVFETKDIEFDISPAAVLYLEQPIKGNQSVSMIDLVYTIQMQVDSLCNKIHLAYELSPANITWVMQGSEVKASMLTNEIGQVWPFKPVPGVSSPPVIVATPPALDAQYLPMLQFWVSQGLETVGISQLSAQAKKPSGLNSGVALQTVEDVESDRHNPWLQSYIRFFMDCANIFIQVAPKTASVLPKKLGRARITWKDIKDERESFSIQFSASSSLSKDPKVKMEQIEKLIAMKIINPSQASTLLEFPDLEDAYSITSAAYDYNQRIIERAVEEDIYEFHEVTDIQQLFAETVNTLMRLDSNDEKPEVLERLVHLLEVVKGKMDAMEAAAVPAVPPPEPFPGKPPSAPGPTGPIPVQADQTAPPLAGAGPISPAQGSAGIEPAVPA